MEKTNKVSYRTLGDPYQMEDEKGNVLTVQDYHELHNGAGTGIMVTLEVGELDN